MRNIRIGDKVEVKNTYKGQKGVRGTVIKLTSTKAWVKPIDEGANFRKYKLNLKLL